MHGELVVCAAQACNEVVLPCVNGSFCCIAAMQMWWYKLVGHLVLLVKLFHCSGCFIVQPMGLWLEPSDGEVLKQFLVGLEECWSRSIVEGFCEDSIGVIVI